MWMFVSVVYVVVVKLLGRCCMMGFISTTIPPIVPCLLRVLGPSACMEMCSLLTPILLYLYPALVDSRHLSGLLVLICDLIAVFSISFGVPFILLLPALDCRSIHNIYQDCLCYFVIHSSNISIFSFFCLMTLPCLGKSA